MKVPTLLRPFPAAMTLHAIANARSREALNAMFAGDWERFEVLHGDAKRIRREARKSEAWEDLVLAAKKNPREVAQGIEHVLGIVAAQKKRESAARRRRNRKAHG